jgi:hypothetical protein
MEHAAHIVEAVLALSGGLKFCHEIFEVLHHLVHLLKK